MGSVMHHTVKEDDEENNLRQERRSDLIGFGKQVCCEPAVPVI